VPDFLTSECRTFCNDNPDVVTDNFDSQADCVEICVQTHRAFDEQHVNDYWHWWDEVEEAD
jgi:hypothetical protein